jgi:hypothetical protein
MGLVQNNSEPGYHVQNALDEGRKGDARSQEERRYKRVRWRKDRRQKEKFVKSSDRVKGYLRLRLPARDLQSFLDVSLHIAVEVIVLCVKGKENRGER